MPDKMLINIMGIRCKPEVEEKYNRWHEEVHIPLILRFKGIRAAKKCKIVNPTPEYPTYLAIYEFENREAFQKYLKSPELAAVLAEMKETWKEPGHEVVWRVQYEVSRSWTTMPH
jgi:antibiotic biosynthesis monooxygenase (ABM) superfamily enzyme